MQLRYNWAYTEHLVHPVDMFRARLLELGAVPMSLLPQGGHVVTAGLIVARQKPPTAKGYAFYVIEDGFYRIQVVISPDLWARCWETLRDASILLVVGLLERTGRAWTLRAERVMKVVTRVRPRDRKHAGRVAGDPAREAEDPVVDGGLTVIR